MGPVFLWKPGPLPPWGWLGAVELVTLRPVQGWRYSSHGGTYIRRDGRARYCSADSAAPPDTLTCLYRGFYDAWAELRCSLELRAVTCLCGWIRLRFLALALRICSILGVLGKFRREVHD